MKLIGDLKKKVEKTSTKEEARETIAKAGMLLDDDELEQVSGGITEAGNFWWCCGVMHFKSETVCKKCGKPRNGLNAGSILPPPPPPSPDSKAIVVDDNCIA